MELEENPFCIQESFQEQDTNLEDSMESQITGKYYSCLLVCLCNPIQKMPVSTVKRKPPSIARNVAIVIA